MYNIILYFYRDVCLRFLKFVVYLSLFYILLCGCFEVIVFKYSFLLELLRIVYIVYRVVMGLRFCLICN